MRYSVIHFMVYELDGKVEFVSVEHSEKVRQLFLGLSYAKASSAIRQSLADMFGVPKRQVKAFGQHKCGVGLRMVSYEIQKD